MDHSERLKPALQQFGIAIGDSTELQLSRRISLERQAVCQSLSGCYRSLIGKPPEVTTCLSRITSKLPQFELAARHSESA